MDPEIEKELREEYEQAKVIDGYGDTFEHWLISRVIRVEAELAELITRNSEAEWGDDL